SQANGAPLLATLANLTGGRINPAPRAIYHPTTISARAVQEIGPPLLWLAPLLLPPHWGLRPPRPDPWRNHPPPPNPPQHTRAPHIPPETPPAPAPQRWRLADIFKGQQSHPHPDTQTALDQLREAQEQARKRARGEE